MTHLRKTKPWSQVMLADPALTIFGPPSRGSISGLRSAFCLLKHRGDRCGDGTCDRTCLSSVATALRSGFTPRSADPKHPRKFIFRINPRDLREVYFWDPSNKMYIPIPYRDRWRPPTSRREIQAVVRRLKAKGCARVDEVLIFQAIKEMRIVEQESERKTKKARRTREMRENPPTHPSATSAKSAPRALKIPETDLYPDTVEAVEGIIEADWP
jgi:hypothetical protein